MIYNMLQNILHLFRFKNKTDMNTIQYNDFSSAIVVIDMQNDFVTGTLAVTGATKIIEIMEKFISRVHKKTNAKILYIRDWHPKNHCSFKENGGRFPAHCIANTPGADFAFSKGFVDVCIESTPHKCIVFNKGVDADHDEHSPFNTNIKSQDELEARYDKLIRINDVTDIFICGITIEDGVKQTALDLKNAGFHVTVLLDLCRGIDPITTNPAIAELKAKGIDIL